MSSSIIRFADLAFAKTTPMRVRLLLSLGALAFSLYYVIFRVGIASRTLADPDIFMHITVGQWILDNWRFPVLDQFSQTAHGKIWRAADWMSEIALAALYRSGGWSGVTAGVALTIGTIAAVLSMHLARILRFSIALGSSTAMMFLISPHFLARPVIFSYLLLMVWCILVLEVHDRNAWTDRKAFILVPIIFLWANVHSSFTFGLAIFAFFFCEAAWRCYREGGFARLRKLLPLAIAVGVAIICTPYGIFSALRTLILMRIPALYQIDEWGASDFHGEKAYLLFFLGLVALLAAFEVRLRGARLATLLMTMAFAMEFKRGLGLFALISPLLLARPFATAFPWARADSVRADPVLRFLKRRLVGIIIVCAFVLCTCEVIAWVRPAPSPRRTMTPDAALAAANAAALQGRVLNSYGFGGYLMFKHIAPFVDGRVALYGNDFLQAYFAAMHSSDPAAARRLLQSYDVSWALLEPNEPIVRALQEDQWSTLYRDQIAVVLVRP